jgi:hypothetical protein
VTSTFAEIVLYLSIPLMVGAFFVLRPIVAVMVVALGAEMFLPEGPVLKLPLTPGFDKHTLPYLCILIACLIRSPGRVTKAPREKWISVLALLLIGGGVATALTNSDGLVFGNAGQVYVAGLTIKDGFYMGLSNFTETFLPFYVGYALFRKQEEMEKLLSGLAVAGLVYIPFALVELRLSPQWHRWVYGYAQHADFSQAIRWGGYRPMIFMPHGLAVGRFFTVATFAIIVVAKTRRHLFGLSTKLLGWTQFIVLVACKSTGAILFSVVGAPLLALAKPKRQLLLAAVLAWATLLYPLLRLSGIFPVDAFVDAAGAMQAERGGSLAFRFLNEDQVLKRTRDRIVFGWGEYGRNMVHDWEGKKDSVLDGYWLIRMSVSGLVGFLTAFAPLLIPVFIARRRLRTLPEGREQWVVAGVAFTVSILALDLIPNGLWGCYPFLMAGALTRRLREAKAEQHERVALQAL